MSFIKSANNAPIARSLRFGNSSVRRGGLGRLLLAMTEVSHVISDGETDEDYDGNRQKLLEDENVTLRNAMILCLSCVIDVQDTVDVLRCALKECLLSNDGVSVRTHGKES